MPAGSGRESRPLRRPRCARRALGCLPANGRQFDVAGATAAWSFSTRQTLLAASRRRKLPASAIAILLRHTIWKSSRQSVLVMPSSLPSSRESGKLLSRPTWRRCLPDPKSPHVLPVPPFDQGEPKRVLRPNGPSPDALSQGRGVPAKPDLAPVARDCDHPSTRERVAFRRALRCGEMRIGVMCHHSSGHRSLVPARLSPV